MQFLYPKGICITEINQKRLRPPKAIFGILADIQTASACHTLGKNPTAA